MCIRDRLLESGQSLRTSTGHVSLEKAASLHRWGQVFALFIHDDKQGSAYSQYCLERDSFQRQLLACSKKIVQCRTAQDLKNAFAKNQYAAILSVENGSALEGRLDRLAEFANEDVYKRQSMNWGTWLLIGGLPAVSRRSS